MQTVLFIWQPTKFYSDHIEQKVAKRDNMIGRLILSAIKKVYSKANARTAEYCIKNALDDQLCAIDKPGQKYLITMSDCLPTELLANFDYAKVVLNQNQLLKSIEECSSQVDCVVLLYSDAIGQGFERVELLLKGNGKRIYVLNGRKRFFILSNEVYRKIRLRRIIEKYCFFELIFSALFIIFIWPYFFYEWLTRQKSRVILRKERLVEQVDSKYNSSELKGSRKIADYWSSKPQTYGIKDGKAIYADNKDETVTVNLGSKEFFNQVDKTFYSWNQSLHYNSKGDFFPFSKIFNYEKYKEKPVLEVGCGMGTMAMNWAKKGANIHAIDLSQQSIEQTRERFRILNLEGDIRQSDARELPFESNQFSYVYSWGVLHHSPDINKSFEEIYRVLVPGGQVGIMLYNRNSLLFRYFIQYNEGFLHFENNFLNLLQLASRYGDGYMEEGNPHTYPVTKKEVLNEIMPQYKNLKIKLFGTDIPWMLSYLCQPYSKRIPLYLIKSIARRFGWSMWIEAEK